MNPGVVLLPIPTVSADWLIGWLALYLMRRLELVDWWKWLGYSFLLLFAVATQLVSPGKWL